MSFAFLFCSKSALPYGKPHESLSNIARTFPSVKKCYSTSQVVGTANASLDLSPFLKQIEDIVKGSDVVLFMKGRPEAPQVLVFQFFSISIKIFI